MKPRSSPALSNAEIADRLASLAQLLSARKENRYKIRAYQRAAATIRTLPESLDAVVRDDADLTRYRGIGAALASAIREIVLTGSLTKLDTLRSNASPMVASISQYPRLDPNRVLRVYQQLAISSVDELRDRLESGEVEKKLGARMAQHLKQGLTDTHTMLLSQADDLRGVLEKFLVGPCSVRRAEVVGDYRRRVEVIDELVFLVDTDDLAGVIARLEGYGGGTPLLSSGVDHASFSLSSGVRLRIQLAGKVDWGLQMVAGTGSQAHLGKLAAATGRLRAAKSGRSSLATEAAVYRRLGLAYIEPELREGHDEIERAANGSLPNLVTTKEIRGELHAHSTSSDGRDSIQDMADAARELGYEYTGITDHSQSLKLAGGVSAGDLWKQLRYIDRLNGKLRGFRILKSSEVDILADGSLDYPDDLLAELDYTVCSIHSRFSLGRREQTVRIMRAMDNKYFNILGHATGRKLLKRHGYGLDLDRVIAHAKQNGCFFEINSNPDRLDLSAENARLASSAGVKIAIDTDAHSTRELGLVRYGIDQGRRAGLEPSDVLNCLPWKRLAQLFRR